MIKASGIIPNEFVIPIAIAYRLIKWSWPMVKGNLKKIEFDEYLKAFDELTDEIPDLYEWSKYLV